MMQLSVANGLAPSVVPVLGKTSRRMSQFSTADTVRFSGKLRLNQATTIPQSRYVNERVTLNHETMVEDLLARLDEAMTVTGEAYCKNEAFTTLIDLDIKPQAWASKTGSVDAKVDTQVEHTMNVGGKKNIGIMVIASKANTLRDGYPIANTRAAFNAIDPESVHTELDQGRLFGLLEKLVQSLKTPPYVAPNTLETDLDTLRLPRGMRPVPVQDLTITPSEQALNRKSSDWNQKLSTYYKQLAARLGAKDPAAAAPDLMQAVSSDTRLINSNIYVRPEMLNKKRTGHGGIAAANAVRDMLALTKKTALRPDAITVDRISANYLAPFTINDALQFDTTIDHVSAQGEIFMSSRIYKFDTKRQLVEGPVILVNAKLKGSALGAAATLASEPDALQRRQDALDWNRTYQD